MVECAHERKNNMFGSSSKLDVDSTGEISIFKLYELLCALDLRINDLILDK